MSKIHRRPSRTVDAALRALARGWAKIVEFCRLHSHTVTAGLGALVVGVASFAAVAFAGAVWGAINRVAPCYGGAAYRPALDQIVGGAIFGMLAAVVFVAAPTALVGAVLGAVTTALYTKWKGRKPS